MFLIRFEELTKECEKKQNEKDQIVLVTLQMEMINYLENNREKFSFKENNSRFYFCYFLKKFITDNPEKCKMVKNHFTYAKVIRLNSHSQQLLDIWDKVFREFVENDKNTRLYYQNVELKKKWWYI